MADFIENSQPIPNSISEISERLNLTDVSQLPATDFFIAKTQTGEEITLREFPFTIDGMTAALNTWMWLSQSAQKVYGDEIVVPTFKGMQFYPANSLMPEKVVVMSSNLSGQTYFEKLKNNELSDADLQSLARFIHLTEQMPFAPTPVTLKRYFTSDSEWANKYFENLNAWSAVILKKAAGNKPMENLVGRLKDMANFSQGNNGLHGRPRLGNYALENGKLNVGAWEITSSTYGVPYYETASNLCYILVWMNSVGGYDYAKKLYDNRVALFETEEEKLDFLTHFPATFAQRVMGDLTDVLGKEYTSDGVRVSNMEKLASDLGRFMNEIGK